MELQKQKLEHEMTKLVDELDRSHLRKMQGDMHRCAAACCDNASYSLDRTHACIENCGVPLNNTNNYVQAEINSVQSRLQRCVMQCNDEIRDMMEPNPTREQNEKYSAKFEACAIRCVDKHIDSIPKLLQTMKAAIARGNVPTVPS